MKKQVLVLFGVGLFVLGLFWGIFSAFQNDILYHHSLGKISSNYERIGTWDNYEIKKVKKPYVQVSNEKFLQWDASIYKCISERMYKQQKECYGRVRSAFFPLFPLVWQLTGLSAQGIAVFNFVLFAISMALLVSVLSFSSLKEKVPLYLILVTYPSTIIFHVPYTESVFVFSVVLAVFGYLKKKYWCIFIGIMLMAMVRPATLFVAIAFGLVEVYYFSLHRNFRDFIQRSLSVGIPYCLGLFGAFFVQYLSSGSWKTFFLAHDFWKGAEKNFFSVSDWSTEGFGLNSFSIVFIVVPSVAFVCYRVHRSMVWHKDMVKEPYCY